MNMFARRSARGVLVLAAVAAVTLLAACVPPPTWDPADRLPRNWGAGQFTPVAAGVAYDPFDQHPQKTADIYLPRAGGNRGVLIYVHGGAFTGGDKSQLFDHDGLFVHELDRGFAIVNINYRLGAFPMGVLDLDAAVRFARSPQAAALGLNPATVIVAGHSAGGTIAADQALAYNRGNVAPFGQLEPVDGWVSMAGPLDFDIPAQWLWSVHIAWQTFDPTAPSIANLDATDPPGLVIQGDQDALVAPRNATVFRDRAAQVGYNRLNLDYVTAAPTDCRNHSPACGASVSNLDRYIGAVSARAF
jgi:acetyl esterase/lipase